jgi:hypothetical protein
MVRQVKYTEKDLHRDIFDGLGVNVGETQQVDLNTLMSLLPQVNKPSASTVIPLTPQQQELRKRYPAVFGV